MVYQLIKEILPDGRVNAVDINILDRYGGYILHSLSKDNINRFQIGVDGKEMFILNLIKTYFEIGRKLNDLEKINYETFEERKKIYNQYIDNTRPTVEDVYIPEITKELDITFQELLNDNDAWIGIRHNGFNFNNDRNSNELKIIDNLTFVLNYKEFKIVVVKDANYKEKLVFWDINNRNCNKIATYEIIFDPL